MQIYEKFVFRGIEVQFFSRTAVKFELNRVYEFIGEVTENRPFWDVLAYKLVGVLDQAFLPGGIRVCEIDLSVGFPAAPRVRLWITFPIIFFSTAQPVIRPQLGDSDPLRNCTC
jgi:hypothetical protein